MSLELLTHQNNCCKSTSFMLGFTLQLRRKVPTQQDILAPSFKVAVSLTEDEALALAAELLSVVASRRGFQPESSDEEPE